MKPQTSLQPEMNVPSMKWYIYGACSRLHRGGLQHPLSLRLQTERVVQLVTLQQVLRQWGQSSLQMAPRKAL